MNLRLYYVFYENKNGVYSGKINFGPLKFKNLTKIKRISNYYNFISSSLISSSFITSLIYYFENSGQKGVYRRSRQTVLKNLIESNLIGS